MSRKMSGVKPNSYSFGLIGYPLGHSWSPLIHAAALDALGLVGDYRLYPIPPLPDGEKTLKDRLAQLRTRELDGLNVTIPHKQSVIPLVDDLSPAARMIGAVNTLLLQDGRLIGENTDAPGFLADLRRFLSGCGWHFSDPHPLALVLGAGGSARAVVYALIQAGWQVTIAARRQEQGEALMAAYQKIAISVRTKFTQDSIINNQLSAILLNKTSLLESEWLWSGRPVLIVNTTPAGMSPDIHASPWPDGAPFTPSAVVYDLIYNPAETVLVRTARAAGLPAITGAGMLVEQAALAFELWTRRPAPREVMLRSVRNLHREYS